jgi:cytoskeletal protein RodZ
LESIATSTKISTRMLRALEDENFDQLPGGVFNKGFVRAYARQVGLNEEETVIDYLAAYHDSQSHSQKVVPNLRGRSVAELEEQIHPADFDGTDRRRQHYSSNTAGNGNGRAELPSVDSSADSPPVAIGTLDKKEARMEKEHRPDQHRIRSKTSPERRAQERRRQERRIRPTRYPAADLPATFSDKPRPLPWGVIVGAILLTAAAAALIGHHRRLQTQTTLPQSTIPAGFTTTSSSVPRSPEVSRAMAIPPPTAPPASREPASLDVPVNRMVASRTLPQPAKKSPPQKFTLVIRAAETSWVSIAADGQSIASETLIAPANTSIRATQQIVVKTNNAEGLSFLLNGKQVQVVGNPGQTRTFIFDASGIRDSTGTQPSN